jgi:hypothetical protein
VTPRHPSCLEEEIIMHLGLPSLAALRNGNPLVEFCPGVADLAHRLVEQLDDRTRGELRLIVFMLAFEARDNPEVEQTLGLLYDRLEPKV